MTPRRILFVTNRVPYPLKDGGNLAMNAMIEGYYKAGWDVSLLAMNTTKHYIKHEQLEKLFTHLHSFNWVDVDNTLKWKDILKNFFFGKEPEHAQRFYSEAFRAELKSQLISFAPDVVQVESVYLSTYLPVIRKYSDAVAVLRMHNVEYQIWQGLAKKTKNKIKSYYLESLSVRVRNFERAAWKDYDLLLAITSKDAHLVQRIEEVANVITAPFSIEAEKIKLNTGNEAWVGYHIGAMDWIPNYDGMRWFLHRAWPKIQKAIPMFEFYFAGRGMPQEFKDMDIKGVHCLDEVPDADEFISNKKILIVPLWSGGGIRVKILEAMAAGKIVISTSKGIKGIEAKPQEHYLRAHSPEDFAKAIKWCLDNKKQAEAMAENARKLVLEKYEQGSVIKNVITEVESLLKRKRL
jgi:glycosyltransferase involved in cell wall biosynthesis